jgi:hypothetical protein
MLYFSKVISLYMMQFLSFIELVLSYELDLYYKFKMFSSSSCLDNDRWRSTMKTLSWSLRLRVCKASLSSSTRCWRGNFSFRLEYSAYARGLGPGLVDYFATMFIPMCLVEEVNHRPQLCRPRYFSRLGNPRSGV